MDGGDDPVSGRSASVTAVGGVVSPEDPPREYCRRYPLSQGSRPAWDDITENREGADGTQSPRGNPKGQNGPRGGTGSSSPRDPDPLRVEARDLGRGGVSFHP